MIHRVDLTVALSSHDHTLELTSGAVEIAGTRPTFVELTVPETAAVQDWDVSEMSLIDYAMLRATGDVAIVAIPVFTSRMFPHAAIHVRGDRVTGPSDLRGKRVGISAWTDSAGVWARGLLSDMYGLAPEQMEWWQVDGDGRGTSGVDGAPVLPEGVVLHSAGGRSLAQLISEGEIDALIAPSVPDPLSISALSGGVVRRLFGDLAPAERAYYEHTRCLPPMHVIAIRRDVLETYPWLASNLYRAFEVAKRRYFTRLTEISASRTAIPWAASYVAEVSAMFGGDLWPYGVDANRPSLEVLRRYGTAQGLFAPAPEIDELFAPIEAFVANEQ